MVSNSDFFGFKASDQLLEGAKTGEMACSKTQLGKAQGFLEYLVPGSKEVLKNGLGHVQRHCKLKASSLVKYGTIQESKLKVTVFTVNIDTKDKKPHKNQAPNKQKTKGWQEK